jgi:hypothetical protein
LDPSEIVHEPGTQDGTVSTSSQRVCQSCHDDVTASVSENLRGLGPTTLERIFIDQQRLSIPGHLTRRHSSSQLSDLAE